MSAGEDLYVLRPPDSVERHAGGSAHVLLRARWADLGPGRTATAAALLSDVAGGRVVDDVVRAFVREILAPHPGTADLILAVREVDAWYAERAPEVARAAAQRAATAHEVTLPQLLAARDRELARPPLAAWLDVYRTIHGPPAMGLEDQEAS